MIQQEAGDDMPTSDVVRDGWLFKVQIVSNTFSCLILVRSPVSKSSLYSAPLVLAPARAVT